MTGSPSETIPRFWFFVVFLFALMVAWLAAQTPLTSELQISMINTYIVILGVLLGLVILVPSALMRSQMAIVLLISILISLASVFLIFTVGRYGFMIATLTFSAVVVFFTVSIFGRIAGVS